MGLEGNAASSWLTPFGVGTRPPAVDAGEPAKRWCSTFADPKNQILSFLIGPPTVPPKRLSTKPGTSGLMQPVEVAWPGRQKPRRGFFSLFSSESKVDPCQ